MCNVCCANKSLSETSAGSAAAFSWSDGRDGRGIEVEATGDGAEFRPALFRFRRTNGDWTYWIGTQDLAGSLGRLGLDIKWGYVHPDVQAWVNGGEIEPVLAWLTRA
jgi:hypothetical protein